MNVQCLTVCGRVQGTTPMLSIIPIYDNDHSGTIHSLGHSDLIYSPVVNIYEISLS